VVVFEGLVVVVLQELRKVMVRSSDDTPNMIHAWRPMLYNVLRAMPSPSCCHVVVHQSRVLHLYFNVLGIFLCRLSRSIVGPKSNGCLSLLLGIWFILQCFDSVNQLVSPVSTNRFFFSLPSLVCASLAVSGQAVLALKPFCTLDAVKLTKAWEILCCFSALVLFQMLR